MEGGSDPMAGDITNLHYNFVVAKPLVLNNWTKCQKYIKYSSQATNPSSKSIVSVILYVLFQTPQVSSNFREALGLGMLKKLEKKVQSRALLNPKNTFFWLTVQDLKNTNLSTSQQNPQLLLRGCCMIFKKINMFWDTFRLLVCVKSNFD